MGTMFELKLFFAVLISFLITFYLIPILATFAIRLKVLDVPDGKYSYKFVVNGDEWIPDPSNPDKETTDYGDQSVVTINSNTASNASSSSMENSDGDGTLFTIEVLNAGRVELWGSWNDWISGTNMKRINNKWQVRLKLKPGRYEYKFTKDGDWDVLNKDNRIIEVE